MGTLSHLAPPTLVTHAKIDEVDATLFTEQLPHCSMPEQYCYKGSTTLVDLTKNNNSCNVVETRADNSVDGCQQ